MADDEYATIDIEHQGDHDHYVQADGGDIVYVEQYGDGTARVVVYDSNHEEGETVFEGQVRVDGHRNVTKQQSAPVTIDAREAITRVQNMIQDEKNQAASVKFERVHGTNTDEGPLNAEAMTDEELDANFEDLAKSEDYESLDNIDGRIAALEAVADVLFLMAKGVKPAMGEPA